MEITIEATLRIPVKFKLNLDAYTLGEISLGDLASIEPEIREHLVDAEGRGEGEIEVTVMDDKMRCYFDSEIDM